MSSAPVAAHPPSVLRRLAFPLALAAARLRSRPERLGLATLGIALAAALLGGLLATSLAAQDAAVARSTSAIPAADRAVRAVWGGTPAQGTAPFRALDRRAREAVGPVLGRPPFAVALFRETRIGGALVDLAAADDIRRIVRLTSGRLPHSCRPARCEVLQLAGRGPLPRLRGLRIVRVGRATVTSPAAFAGLVSERVAGAVAGGYPTTAPFLLADGIAAVARAPALAFDYRTYAWVVPVRAGGVHPWNVDDVVSRVERARSSLVANADAFQVSAPQDELLAAAARADTGGRRLLLLGGVAIALLLAFTILTAARLRRDTRDARRRLVWAGATRWQAVAVPALEATAAAVAGGVLGWLAGLGLGWLAARRFSTSGTEIVGRSLVAGGGLAAAGALVAVAAVVLVSALLVRPIRVGGIAVGVFDVLAVAAAAVIVVAFARGDVAASNAEGTGTVLLLLPGLVALVAAVVTVRALGPALRALERAGRRGPVPLRLAALSLARSPGQAALAAAFVAVSVGLALFAATYRATLLRGQRDQASFAVPADVVVSENLRRLVPVLDAAPLGRYRRLADAAPAVRLSGDVPQTLSVEAATVLGIPARALARIDGWRSDFSPLTPAELARRIEPPRGTSLRGIRLPQSAAELRLPVRMSRGAPTLRAAVETSRGDFVSVALRSGAGGAELRARLPADARGGKLVAFRVEPPRTGLHDSGNVVVLGPLARGRLVLGQPVAATPSGLRRLPVDWADWVGSGGVRVLSGGRSGTVRYVLTADRDALLRHRQPTDGRPVPAVVSRRVAAAADARGIVPLDLSGQIVPLRVAATAERFPSTSGDFVVADLATLATAMNASFPGSAVPSEVWLNRRTGQTEAALDAAVRRPPFDVLAHASRARLERALRADPLARGALLALGATAAVALVLALAGLLLAVLADLRDERAETRELEAQGAPPRALRRHVRLRAAVVCLFGLVAGVVAGFALSRLVVRFVAVTANAQTPEPPLVTGVDWGVTAGLVAIFLLLAALVVAIPTARAFGDRVV